MNVPNSLVEAVDALEESEFGMTFWGSGRFISYVGLRSTVFDVGRRIAGFGLGKGERVVVVLPDEAEFVQIFLGALCAGVVPVPLYPPFIFGQLESYRLSLERIVQQSEARFVISSSEVRDLLGPSGSALPFVTFDEVMATPPAEDLPAVHPSDVAFLQYTSGSTAEPKGVVVTHESLLANARSIATHLEITQDDRGVSWLPLYHDMGLIGFVIIPVLIQGSVWIIPPLEFARRPALWCELIDEVRGTISYAPNFAYSLLARRMDDEQLAELDLTCWRVAGCGAEPIQIDGLRAFADRFAETGFAETALLPSYGLAEMTLAVALASLDEPPQVLSVLRDPLERESVIAFGDSDSGPSIAIVSCGTALAGYEIRVEDPNTGHSLGEDLEGEIVVSGPSQANGYFLDPENTERTFRKGRVHTGDLGFLHSGQLYITGRSKDLIVLNGRNHHPQDIEEVVCEESGVRRGNAVAFASTQSGVEQAIVVLEGIGEVEPAELARRVRSRVLLSRGVVLSKVVVVRKDTLPRTSSGKVRRGKTRDSYLRDELVKVPE